ncbi:MAG: GTP-binding protein [Candidatus Heimdallarchaeota archaeon]|nr:GTP-binding protein [Candidatus Heimdallarchaeota archaeon]
MGKTSIRRNFMGQTFIQDHLSTLGADFAVKKIDLDDGALLELQIWDLAGQPGFENLRQRFFQGATSAFMVFDLTSKDSFNDLNGWFEQFWKAHPTKNLPIAILGNKYDLEGHEISAEDVEEYIQKIKQENNIPNTFIKYYETSAKTGHNIETVFMEIAKVIIDEINKS